MTINYRPLSPESPDIRVLTIQPGESHTKIRCTLEHHSIDEDYHCLSYVWGVQEPKEKISVNGEEFEVGPNLGRFLNAARLCGFTGKIWIDAICLNQKDIAELSYQVSRMGKIYSSAASVILWLDLTVQEVEILRKLQNLILYNNMEVESHKDDPTEKWSTDQRRQCFNRRESQDLRSTYNSISQRLRDYGIDLSSSTLYRERLLNCREMKDIHECFNRPYDRPLNSRVRGLCYLLHHPVIKKVHASPYWTRVWIVQELTLARQIQILSPSGSVDFLVIEPFLHWCRSRTAADFYTYPRMSLEQESKDERFDPNDFSLILHINEERQCLKQRDRLYAMLSMTKDDHKVNVDYTMRDGEVFWSVFSYQWHKHKAKLMQGVDLEEDTKRKFRQEQGLLGTIAVRINEILQPLAWKNQILAAMNRVQEMCDVLISLQFALDLNPSHNIDVCPLSDLKQHIEQQPNRAYFCRDVLNKDRVQSGIDHSSKDSDSIVSDACGICIPIPDYENELVLVVATICFTNSTNSFLLPGLGKVLRWRFGQWLTLCDYSTAPLDTYKSRR